MIDMYYLCANKNKSHSYRTDVSHLKTPHENSLFCNSIT
ncbi:hypothetical protein ECP02999172_4906 [Escherichia coli P0299917.2]|nr:hypothetical protein ECP02999172_4906 [Escherichia coli P0299917.2]